MTRICLDCRYVGQRPSGIGEVSFALARAVPKLAPDIQFVLLCRHDSPLLEFAPPNVEARIVNHPANGPGTMWAMPWLTDLRAVDLFHAPFNILPAGLGMKTVTTIHDIMWLTHPQWCKPGIKGRIEHRFFGLGIERALDRSHRIATVSEATAEAVAKYRPDCSERLRVTRSGVAARFSKRAPDSGQLMHLGLDPDRSFILCVGQFAPYKNHEAALRAYAEAIDDGDGVDLVFVQRQGDGRTALARLAGELGTSGRVHFLGSLAERDLIALYSAAKLLLHPSLCEGFGNPLAEAMACGCPVVTSNFGAMAEVTGGAARLVDPRSRAQIAKAIREVCFDDALASAMSEKGRARASELSWEGFARANLDVYRELLE